MRIGYVRVSINEQNLDLQRDALLKAGVFHKNIYTDKVTGVKAGRPGLTKALSRLRVGDTFIVWRLDRVGRSLKHLIETVTALKNQGIVFKSLMENIDTATANGTLVFQIFGVLAEFERNLVTEWTMAGLEEAKARGSKRGRRPRDPYSDKVVLAKQLYSERTIPLPEILTTLNISKTTLYRWLDLNRGQQAKL
jgi:DNA invertase Pin-like site-specific DNA recombinase